MIIVSVLMLVFDEVFGRLSGETSFVIAAIRSGGFVGWASRRASSLLFYTDLVSAIEWHGRQ
jgi:hypothetical protein